MQAEKAFERALRRAVLPAAVALCCAAPAAAQQEAAVLAKGSGPYFESYLAFQKALGRPVTPFDLSKGKPRFPGELKAVAAFGAKAAEAKFPGGVTVVYALAPGYFPEKPSNRLVRISSLPEPGKAMAVYLQLQPGLKKLTVFHMKGLPRTYPRKLEAAGKAAGVEISEVQISSAAEFPNILRGLAGKTDALWLFPDPELINKTSLDVLAEFACANKIPFYAPSSGLTAFGATAAFAPSFAETGVAAARALQAVLDGKDVPAMVFAEASLTVNHKAAADCGIALGPAGGAKP